LVLYITLSLDSVCCSDVIVESLAKHCLQLSSLRIVGNDDGIEIISARALVDLVSKVKGPKELTYEYVLQDDDCDKGV
jgi:hypothetical protein